MRYRRSHAVRKGLSVQARPPDYRIHMLAGGMGLLTVIVALSWVMLSSTEPTGVLNWLLNSPVSTTEPDLKSAEYKSAMERFGEIDLALARAMTNLQIGPKQVRESQHQALDAAGSLTPVHRTLKVSTFYATAQCNLEIDRSVREAGGTVISAVESSRSHQLSLQIGYGQTITHRLMVVPDPDIHRKTGHIALIVTGLETSGTRLAQEFLRIDRPLTFSINPWRSAGKATAEAVEDRDQEILVDLPMEPLDYPRISPGRTAVLVNQSAQENRRVVRESIAALPMASGVRNFMGSRAVAHPEIMEVVLGEVKKSRRFFVDSGGTDRSVISKMAVTLKVPNPTVWGNLDDSDNQDRILAALDDASFEAIERGPIVVMARARPNTLAVLTKKMERLALRGIQFVHVSALVAETRIAQ